MTRTTSGLNRTEYYRPAISGVCHSGAIVGMESWQNPECMADHWNRWSTRVHRSKRWGTVSSMDMLTALIVPCERRISRTNTTPLINISSNSRLREIYLYNLQVEKTMVWRHWQQSLAIPVRACACMRSSNFDRQSARAFTLSRCHQRSINFRPSFISPCNELLY